MVGSPEYERLYEWTVKTNGMPADFFMPEFYFERKSLVDNRLRELMNIDLRQELERAYQAYYGKNFRLIENWQKFGIDELSAAVRLLPKDSLLAVLERILKNVNKNRAGLPDLLVYNGSAAFFVEVKGEKDKISPQ